MKPIRDAVIVAALLLASIPGLAEDILPEAPAAQVEPGSAQEYTEENG